MLSFKTTTEDAALIQQIADRAAKLAATFDLTYQRPDIGMDITAVHVNSCPLDLEKLLDFDDGNFGHDVFGIRRFLDRDTGELRDCFVPRCARGEG